jgi:hypothetical protein
LRQCLKYIRNLTLFEKRFTPDLYTITAAKQTAGDQYALRRRGGSRVPVARIGLPATLASIAAAAGGERQHDQPAAGAAAMYVTQLQRPPDRKERENGKAESVSQCSFRRRTS